MAEQSLNFLPFRLDLANEQLRREEQCIALRPKTFAILRYLAEHPNRLVTKDELLHTVWGETLVSEEGLRDYLREIRYALGDDAHVPRFVETVRGRGYRFLAKVASSQHSVASREAEGRRQAADSSLDQLATVLPLPDKPSIIVLPFLNLSTDPEQEYFSDGVTEDMTNSLSRLSSLFVISRTSAFTYKNKPTKVQDISQEMGVQWVLEGSVRKSDAHVRVTAQLIDATTDHHLWAERYDRPLTDIFAVQDEVVRKIVTALKVKLTPEEQERFRRAPTNNLEAYDFYLRGQESRLRAYLEVKKEANIQARQMFEKAVGLDPQYAGAYAWLGATYFIDWFYQWNPDPVQSLDRAFELAQRAVALDDSLPETHRLLGYIYLWKRQHDQAIIEAERAVALNPNYFDAYITLGQTLCWTGRPEKAVEVMEKALRLAPLYPPQYLAFLGAAYRMAGRYEEALTPLKKVLTLNSTFWPARISLAACYVELDRLEEARAGGAVLQRTAPDFSLEVYRQSLPYKDPADVEHFLAALRKAGLE